MKILVFVVAIKEEQLADFDVGVTNVSTSFVDPTLSNYALCAHYPGYFPQGISASIQCLEATPPGRYLFIQLRKSDEHLSLCEVNVFERTLILTVCALVQLKHNFGTSLVYVK